MCPDGEIITPDTNCQNFCGAYLELAQVSRCRSLWDASWSCWSAFNECPDWTPTENGAAMCFPANGFETCIETYCGVPANQQQCADIASRYGV